jgi:hypothetical protein
VADPHRATLAAGVYPLYSLEDTRHDGLAAEGELDLELRSGLVFERKLEWTEIRIGGRSN